MFITVDIGGTNVRVAAAESLDEPNLADKTVFRIHNADYDTDIARIIHASREAGRGNIQAVGIGVTGDLNQDKTGLRSGQNIGHWNGRPFITDISQALHCSVVAANDAVAGALAEMYYGAAGTDFAYIIWGTGIGGAAVSSDETGKLHTEKLSWPEYFKAWEYECGGKKLSEIHSKPPEELTDSEWHGIITKFTANVREFTNKTRTSALVFGGGLSVRHRTELEKLSDVLHIPVTVTRFGTDGGLYGGLAVINRSLG